MSKKNKTKGEYAIVLAPRLNRLVLCWCTVEPGGWIHLSEGLELYEANHLRGGGMPMIRGAQAIARVGPTVPLYDIVAPQRTPEMRVLDPEGVVVFPVDEEIWAPFVKKWGDELDAALAKELTRIKRMEARARAKAKAEAKAKTKKPA